MFNYQSKMQEQNFMVGTMEIQNVLNNMMINQFTGSPPDPDFFQDVNDIKEIAQKNLKNQNFIIVQEKYFNQHCLYTR